MTILSLVVVMMMPLLSVSKLLHSSGIVADENYGIRATFEMVFTLAAMALIQQGWLSLLRTATFLGLTYIR